jgi:hypothetical protein
MSFVYFGYIVTARLIGRKVSDKYNTVAGNNTLFLEPISVFSECTCKGCLPIIEMPARQYENMLVVLHYQMNVFVKNTNGMDWRPHTYPKCYDSQTHTVTNIKRIIFFKLLIICCGVYSTKTLR